MKFRYCVITLLVLLMVMCTPVFAEEAIYTIEIPYGTTANDMIMADEPLSLTFDGEEYTLDANFGSFENSISLYGGNIHSIYDLEVPADQFSFEENDGQLLIGQVTINIPYDGELLVLDGNHISGEFTISSRTALTDVYREDIYLPRDAEAKSTIIDRVYLVSFEENGEIQRQAMTLCIGYSESSAMRGGMIDADSETAAVPLPGDMVVLENLHYGAEALDMHMADEENYIMFQGEKYSLDDDKGSFNGAFPVYGGKTHAVHEITIPEDRYSVTDDGTEVFLGSIELNIPTKTELTICAGNRRSGEYWIVDTQTLTDVFVDDIYLPRNAMGEPVIIDRIYFYSYELSGETRRFAISLYVDYEGFTARYLLPGGANPISASEPTSASAVENTVEPGTENTVEPTATTAAIITIACIVIIAIVVIAVSRSRRKDKSQQADEASPDSEPAENPDNVFTKGIELMDNIVTEGRQIPDDDINHNINMLTAVCTPMLTSAKDDPEKAAKLRRFLNYYLPTTLKMVTVLRTLYEHNVSSSEIEKVRSSTIKVLEMLTSACQKQLDNLYRGEVMDTSTDFEVIEKMLIRDGFLDDDFNKMRNNNNNE